MLWLVLQVLFYIFMSLNHLNASEITDPDFNSSDNLGIEVIHNVQPLKDEETVNFNEFKKAVRQKLREIFAIQFPHLMYDIRLYDIENWPEGIDLQGSILWRKDELVRINAGIPFYKFVRRAEPTYPAFNSSENQEILIFHNVQPLKHAEILNGNILKAAVRQKLKEIFAIQFPSSKYSTRNYDIENWPEGIESRGSVNWRKDELIRINERIPIFKFNPRETAAKVDSDRKIIYQHLKNMECLKSASLTESFRQNKMTVNQMMKLMLDRFQVESGNIDAKIIDWRLLNRSQIPLKYKDVPLKTTTIRCKLIYRNSEIVDNIHFFKYANLNDYNQTSENEISQRVDEVVVEETNPLDEQVDICFSEEDQEEDDESINIGEFEIDDQSSLFDESPNEIVFDINRRDLEKIFDFASFDDCHSKDSDSLVPNLEFNMNPDQKCKRNMFELRNIVKADLNRLFKIQFPDEQFKMSHYEIRNWPEGVELIWNRWKKAEIEKIYEKMPEFVFVKRTHKLPVKPSKGIRQSGSLIGILDSSMTYEGTYEILLNRFRQESGQSSAAKINWKLLDRRDIPAKYHGIVIQKFELSLQSLYKNPEIVNNIHFFKSNELKKVSHKRKSEELEIDHHSEDVNWPTSESFKENCVRVLYNDYDFDDIFFNSDENIDSDEIIVSTDVLGSNSPINVKDTRKVIINGLRRVFKTHHPNSRFRWQNYRIYNWPEGVSKDRMCWTMQDMQKIKDNICNFVFEEKNSLDETMTKEGVQEILLARYRQETRDSDASKIFWDKIDRRFIPAKYDGIIFNSKVIKLAGIYRNAEIVDNIHFSS